MGEARVESGTHSYFYCSEFTVYQSCGIKAQSSSEIKTFEASNHMPSLNWGLLIESQWTHS